MIRVGLTGGIGSGKSTVAAVLKQFGVPVYCADERGRWLSDNDPQVLNRIETLFGPEAFLSDGSLDRKYIAAKVFADKELLARLNEIVHPAVRDDYRRWAEQYDNIPYTILESAILFESGFDGEVERVVVVVAPEALRIARTMRRDGCGEASVRARMAAQMTDPERIQQADYVLYADDRELLIPQIVSLDECLRATNQ